MDPCLKYITSWCMEYVPASRPTIEQVIAVMRGLRQMLATDSTLDIAMVTRQSRDITEYIRG